MHGNVGISSFLIFDGGTPASDKLMVSSNEITVTRTYHTIDGSGASSTLSWVKMVGAAHTTLGQMLILKTYDDGRDVTINESGNIRVQGSSIALEDTDDHVMLIWNGSYWSQINSTH